MPTDKRRHYRIKLTDTLEAHDKALFYGGASGVINKNSIKSAITRPYTGYHPKIWQKAAVLFESVCRNHGFADGNKRTAVILSNYLIEKSGYTLNALPKEDINNALEEFAVGVADGQLRKDEIEQWFLARIIKKE